MNNKIITTLALIMFIAQGGLYAADIIAAPNPWVPEGGRTQTGTLAGGITFQTNPSGGDLQGTLLIYTLSGDLVVKDQINSGTVSFTWDGRNDAGNYVASGVYLWVLKSDAATKSGKLIVIR